MKFVHTFGTGRHKSQADITLLFQYICEFNVLQFSRLVKLLLIILTLIHRKVVCRFSGGIYI